MYIICEENQMIIELSEKRKVLRDSFRNGNITGIIINKGLEVIEENALTGNKINSVDLKNVKYIGSSAFENNRISGTLIIPESVEYIGSRAFANNKISEVIVSNPNTVIEYDAFYNNIKNIKIKYKEQNKKLLLGFRREKKDA